PAPAQVALQALAKVHLLGAQIGIAPDPGGAGAVGLPVWLWTAVTHYRDAAGRDSGTWGTLTASATSGALTVTITATAQRIVWNMGDGASVSCDTPGAPYTAAAGLSDSPTCGYRYRKASTSTAAPAGRFTITATTYWRVAWSGGGQAGVLTP